MAQTLTSKYVWTTKKTPVLHESTGITSTSLHCVGGPLGPVVGFPMWATHTLLSQSLPYYSHPLSPSFNRSSAKISLSPSPFEAVSPLQNKHGSFAQHSSGMLEPGLLSPNSRDVAQIIAFMEKTLWVNVSSGGGGKCVIPFTSWVSFFKWWVFIWVFFLVGAGSTIKRLTDSFVAVRPSWKSSWRLPETGKGRGVHHIDTPSVVCTGLLWYEIGIMLQFSFSSSVFPGHSVAI